MRPRIGPADVRGGREAEWQDAQLVERVELLESEMARLKEERELLLTELVVARSWVKELALWLDEAQTRTGGLAPAAPEPAVDREAILSPRTARLLREYRRQPISWRGLAAAAALAVVPWLLVGGLAYVVWSLVS